MRRPEPSFQVIGNTRPPTYPSWNSTVQPQSAWKSLYTLTWKDPSIWTSWIASSTPSRTCRRPRNSLPSCIKSATLWRPSLTYSCSWKAMRAIASDLLSLSPLASRFCARNPKLARRSLSCLMQVVSIKQRFRSTPIAYLLPWQKVHGKIRSQIVLRLCQSVRREALCILSPSRSSVNSFQLLASSIAID